MEKLNQIVYVWFAGAYTDAVNVNRTKQTLQLAESLGTRPFIPPAKTAARRINGNGLAGFGVCKFDNSDFGQRQFSGVTDRHRYTIMTLV